MTTESKALVERTRASPPSRLPNEAEVKEILSVFHGWDSGGAPVPTRPTAVILWKLVQMGFAPHDINLVGGKPYINVEGFTAHAHRLLAAQGRHYGVDFMTRHRLVTDKTELDMVGAKQGDTTIAWEFMVPKWKKLTHPDGTVEETREWQVVATEWGRGNPTNTVIKTPKGNNQPIEMQHPQRMALVRATRHGWKMVAPAMLPADVGLYDEANRIAIDPDMIEGTYRTVPEHSLAEGSTAADTAAAPPEAPEATQEPSAPVSPGAEAPVAPAETSALTPATVPVIKPANPAALTLEAVRADRAQVERIKTALREANALGLVKDFGYSLQLGVDAVLQLAADGYSVEQIVAVVKGEAKPSLGWE